VCLALAKSLPEIVPTLLHRFSSKEGYAFYDDAVPTSAPVLSLPTKYTETDLMFAVRALQRAGIQVGMITNADARIASVLDSLGSSSSDGDGKPLGLTPLVISEQLGAEKPAAPIFHEACRLAGVHAAEVLHVGDELEAYGGSFSSCRINTYQTRYTETTVARLGLACTRDCCGAWEAKKRRWRRRRGKTCRACLWSRACMTCWKWCMVRRIVLVYPICLPITQSASRG
jgi:hypothetical protein